MSFSLGCGWKWRHHKVISTQRNIRINFSKASRNIVLMGGGYSMENARCFAVRCEYHLSHPRCLAQPVSSAGQAAMMPGRADPVADKPERL